MSCNYHIREPEPKTDILTAHHRLDHYSRLLAASAGSTHNRVDRNFLTRTLDATFITVRKYFPPAHYFFAAMTALVFYLYLQIVRITSRLITRGVIEWPHISKPSVLALWHRDAPSFLVALAKRPLPIKTVIMIAQDPRGDYLAMLCRMVGLGVVRGDSEKGGWKALQKLATELVDGRCVVLTADGGGPARVAKVGAVALSSATGVPLIPISADCHPAIEERRKWDAARNPVPLCKLTISLSTPREFDAFEDLSTLEEARSWLEKT